MQIILSFLIALGALSSSTTYSSKQIEDKRIEKHDQLVATYGDEYLTILGTDDSDPRD